MISSISDVFGVFPSLTRDPDVHSTGLLNVAGWVPGVGVIPGLFHIAMGLRDENPAAQKVFVARGLTEIAGLGFLNAVPDLIMTIGREIGPDVNLDHPFGFHTENTWEGGDDLKADVISNVLNVAGWVPGLGVIPGLFHIYTGFGEPTSAEGSMFIARGLTEVAGVGFLNAVPDIIMTIGRMTSLPSY